MRSIEFGKRPDGERWKTHHQFDPVHGMTVAVVEPEVDPDTINLVILDTYEGVSVVAEWDKTDPGARARAISLGEIIQDTLEIVGLSWKPPKPRSPRQSRLKAPQP